MPFPTSPANNDITIVNGISYIYSSATTSWTKITAQISNIANITVTNNANLTNIFSNSITANAITVNGNIIPSANITYNLGSPNFRFKDLWLAGNTIYFGGANLTADGANVTINNPGGGSFTISGTSPNNANVSFGNIIVSASTTSTSSTTGALVVSGGAGFAGNIFTAGNIIPSSNVSQNLGTTTSWWNLIYGKSVQAQYADLAENYIADKKYDPGTVVIFGGTNEISTTNISHDTRVAGIISSNPAYLMNAGESGLPVALTGKVPCRVQGPVDKGTVLVTSNIAGVAKALEYNLYNPGAILGKSLEKINDNSIQVIEVVVGRF